MEAKDTVMSDEELARIWATFEPHRHFAEHIAEAQAKISFKAGRREVVERLCQDCTEHPHPAYPTGTGFSERRECPDCWQALVEEVNK